MDTDDNLPTVKRDLSERIQDIALEAALLTSSVRILYERNHEVFGSDSVLWSFPFRKRRIYGMVSDLMCDYPEISQFLDSGFELNDIGDLDRVLSVLALFNFNVDKSAEM